MTTATMTVAEMFSQFIDNLAIDDEEQISYRYGEITCALNKYYRNTESKTANSLQVGSYGRKTAIHSLSDLDMIYVLPEDVWDRYQDGRQSALLQNVKAAIGDRYSRTEMWGDGQVVVVSFDNYEVEVVPAFELEDGSFKYPNTNDGGSWPITKPRSEIKAIRDTDETKNSNLRPLCKMIRAWKNHHGLEMGGLLIDTLAHRFLTSTSYYDNKSFLYYDEMVRDFFHFLTELPEQSFYLSPGGNQRVAVKKKFRKRATKAYKLCLDAIAAEEKIGVNKKWKKVFGRQFPGAKTIVNEATDGYTGRWDNTEEFIDDHHKVDIRFDIELQCTVTQNGFRPQSLLHMINERIPLLPNKSLVFEVKRTTVPEPYELKWKVLNRGPTAKRKNRVRGQIVKDDGSRSKREPTAFKGSHLVECYAIKNSVVVAKDRIDVPISSGE